MKLSEEQFQQTISALGCIDASLIKHEGSSVRMTSGTRAAVILCSAASRHELTSVVVVNVSVSGTGILSSTPMRIGQTFILRLAASSRQPAGAILCSVIQAQRTTTGQCAISAHFMRMLTVGNDHGSDSQFEPASRDLDDQGLAHLREVELKLSQWSM